MAAPTNTSGPGVYIIENLSGPNPVSVTISPSTAGFVGESWYGIPGAAIQCNSWNDYLKFFGGFNPTSVPALANSYLAYSVYMFFVNGGQEAFVTRVAPSLNPGTASSVTLIDQSATPQTTLRLTAGYLGRGGNIGSWGNSLFVDIFSMPNGAGVVAGRFGIRVYKGGYGPNFLVETWTDLSMEVNDYRYAVSILNSPANGSYYLFATDLNDAPVFPFNAPTIQTQVQLTGGTDSSSTYVGPSAADYVNALTAGN